MLLRDYLAYNPILGTTRSRSIAFQLHSLLEIFRLNKYGNVSIPVYPVVMIHCSCKEVSNVLPFIKQPGYPLLFAVMQPHTCGRSCQEGAWNSLSGVEAGGSAA